MKIKSLRFCLVSLVAVTMSLNWSSLFAISESAEVQKARYQAEQDPTNPQKVYELGLALYKDGYHAEADKEWDKALKIRPNFAEPYMSKGKALFNAGKSDEAIVQLKKAVNLNDDLAQAHYLLGTVYFDEGQADKAISEWERTIRLDSSVPEVHDSLGMIYHQKGRFAEAVEQYKKEIQRDPNYIDSYKHLVEAYLGMDNFSQASAALQEFESKIPYGSRSSEDGEYVKQMTEKINKKKAAASSS